MVTGSKVKSCAVSKTQNLRMLKGFNFRYHIRATTKAGGFLNKTVCGKRFQVQLITYTELHNADGIASLCHDCRESVLHM
jgi:hypothetical protein